MGLWLIDKDGNKVRISDPGVTTFNGRTGDIISADGDYTASQVGAVPTERRINGKTLNEDITLSAADVEARPSTWTPTAAQVGARPDTWVPTASEVGAPTVAEMNTAITTATSGVDAGVTSFKGRTGAVTPKDGDYTAAQVGARPDTWTPTASDVGAVPTNRKVNGKSLSTDISLTAADVEARPSTWTPTAAQVGALPTTGGTVSGETTFSGGLAVTKAVANNDMPYFLGIEPFAAGGDVKYIAKGNMLSCIGAAAATHTHTKGTYTASDIGITAISGLSATNVQGALSELKTSVSNGKSQIASAITDKGVSTGATDDFSVMADNIKNIPSSTGVNTDDATATASNILSGKTAYAKGSKITGTIATKTSSSVTVSGGKVSIPAGYYENAVTKTVSAVTQATPSITINTSGLITASASQSAGYVASGSKSATKQLATKSGTTITPGTSKKTAISSGTYATGDIYVEGDTNLIASNIRKGVTIFGIEGTFVVGGSGSTTPENWNGTLGKDWFKGIDLPYSEQYGAIAYGNGIFLALVTKSKTSASKTNRLIKSVDGESWSSVTANIAVSGPCMTFGNGMFVVATSGSTCYCSSDGVNWKKYTNCGLLSTNYPQKMIYEKGVFVAINILSPSMATSSLLAFDHFYYSFNGYEWTQGTFPVKGHWSDICYGNGKFVIVSHEDTPRTGMVSSDGVHWQQTTLPDGDWNVVVYDGNRFLALPYDGDYYAVCDSTGANWSSITKQGVQGKWFNAEHGEGVTVAIDYDYKDSSKIAYLLDGSDTWLLASHPTVDTRLARIIYAQNKFVAMGGAGYQNGSTTASSKNVLIST